MDLVRNPGERANAPGAVADLRKQADMQQSMRLCRGCGALFLPWRCDQQSCTYECGRRGMWRQQSERRRAEREPVLCKVCGTPFLPRTYRSVICSAPRCRKVARVASAARWNRQNKDQRRLTVTRSRHTRRAIALGVAVHVVSNRDWLRLVSRYGGRCAYCAARTDRLTQDHVVPLSRGGRHSIGNILPACISCNASKHNKLLIEWRRVQRALR